ncbi:MAG TPA: hypothetical protein VLX28_03225 [Thermoanaerobaculia bacterium]|nr:hypothetical protein [Thermoanaerobaculia bacterium]
MADFLDTTPALLLFDPHDEKVSFDFDSGVDIPRVIEGCFGFEFYVTDRQTSFLICFNHHDFLIGAGRAKAWVAGIKAEKTLLERLGYDPRWVDYGFLDPAILRDQIAELESGDDTSTEHYRYRSFLAVLKSRATLSEKEIDGYIELAQADPDANMGEAALRDLAEWPNLGEEGYQKISGHEVFLRASMRGSMMWGRLIRALDSSSLAPEDCDSYLEAGNSEVQRLLMDRVKLSRAQLERLRSAGKSRAIRNMAAEKLRSKKVV